MALALSPPCPKAPHQSNLPNRSRAMNRFVRNKCNAKFCSRDPNGSKWTNCIDCITHFRSDQYSLSVCPSLKLINMSRNRTFYTCVLSHLAYRCKRTLLWYTPLWFTHLMKTSERASEQLDCIKTSSPPVSLPFKGQVTGQKAVQRLLVFKLQYKHYYFQVC